MEEEEEVKGTRKGGKEGGACGLLLLGEGMHVNRDVRTRRCRHECTETWLSYISALKLASRYIQANARYFSFWLREKKRN